jgi:hypothetical protein
LGFLAGASERVDPCAVFADAVTVASGGRGQPSAARGAGRAVTENELRPVIGPTFAFDRARAAFEHYFGGPRWARS